MGDKKAILDIKAVCQLTGIHPSTLRAWERRLSIVTPQRTKTGRRKYSFQDVERINLFQTLADQGHSVGTLSALSPEALRSISDNGLSNHSRPPGKTPKFSSKISLLMSDAHSLELERLNKRLRTWRQFYDLKTFIFDLILPLLSEVGQAVSKGKLDLANEHGLSAILRVLLGSILYSLDVDTDNPQQTPVFIFTTPEGELHEFGILLSAILCSHSGFKSYYLGANIPASSLITVVDKINPDYVVLGTSPSIQHLDRYIHKLCKKQPSLTHRLIAGGPHPALDNSKVRTMRSLHEFENFLLKLSDENLHWTNKEGR